MVTAKERKALLAYVRELRQGSLAPFELWNIANKIIHDTDASVAICSGSSNCAAIAESLAREGRSAR